MAHFGVRDLVSMSVRTLRAEPGRVLVPGALVFGFSALVDAVVTRAEETHHLDALEFVLALVAAVIATLGLTFYAGLLDRLVGAVEVGERPPPVAEVLRTAPWGRLVAADLILVAILLASSATLVLPGLILFTLFSIVGPLINMEDHGVLRAFRESVRLVAPNFVPAALGVTLPFVVEEEVVTLIELTVPHEAVGVVVLTRVLTGIVFGTAVGLMEVSLAEHARHGATAATTGEPPGPAGAGDRAGPPEAETR